MKNLNFLAVAAVLFGCTMFANTAQAQTAKGPARNTIFTVKPSAGKNGYEVEITFKYRFQMCDGITLDGFRSKHTPLAYWYEGKRYTEAELKNGCKFKTAYDDLYPNLDIAADVFNDFSGKRVGAGKWTWINLKDWGGCYGDHGAGGFKYPTSGVSGNVNDYLKGMIGFLVLKNIKPKDEPNRDYDIEKCISGKDEPKEEKKAEMDCVEINGVCWATKNVGKPKEFVANPEDAGGYYTWEEAKTVCPDGWRLPTKAEFESLISSGSRVNNGMTEFANGKLKLPMAGWYDTARNINLRDVGTIAAYWTSSTDGGIEAYNYENGTIRGRAFRTNSFQVRCVKK
jgi:uncharacterized protein (TIGR02145 family)